MSLLVYGSLTSRQHAALRKETAMRIQDGNGWTYDDGATTPEQPSELPPVNIVPNLNGRLAEHRMACAREAAFKLAVDDVQGGFPVFNPYPLDGELYLQYERGTHQGNDPTAEHIAEVEGAMSRVRG